MDDKIQLVKANFNKIKEIRTQVMYCFNALEIKLTKLKTTTNEFVKTNKHNVFVFGLDSFQFQGKLIDYEYNDMRKFYFALNNRMYCEYYKLYKLILQYTEEIIGTNKNIEMLKSQSIFPIYKDLEPFKQYDFETIEEIHKTIINLLNNLNEHIFAKETQLQLFQLKQRSGLNINNFVNTFDFDVIVIRQKCLLFLSYLEFFHNIHTKHFKRFSKKMKLMNDYLDEDIKFDEGMHAKEDDNSLRSSASTSSLDSGEELVLSPLSTNNAEKNTGTSSPSSVKSLFKSNVKKVMNSLKMSKPVLAPLSEQNISNHLSSANINKMLESLNSSFDDDPITMPIDDISETIHDHKSVSATDVNETIMSATDAVKMSSIADNIETIHADKSVSIIDESETIKSAPDALKMIPTDNDIDTIHAHNSEAVDNDTDTIKSADDDDENATTSATKKKRNKKKKK